MAWLFSSSNLGYQPSVSELYLRNKSYQSRDGRPRAARDAFFVQYIYIYIARTRGLSNRLADRYTAMKKVCNHCGRRFQNLVYTFQSIMVNCIVPEPLPILRSAHVIHGYSSAISDSARQVGKTESLHSTICRDTSERPPFRLVERLFCWV